MTAESLSNIVEQSLNSIDLEKLKAMKGASAKDVLLAVMKLVSKDYAGAAETTIQTIADYREGEFFRKYCRYLLDLAETTPEQRHQFSQEIQDKAEDFSGNVICGMVDRLDNINKETVFARLSVARIHGFISIDDFFRLHSLLERIPYVDLKELPKYKEPFYDESGDTELLIATGALVIHTIDANESNKYVLSALGEKLLLWGCGVNIEMKRERGTNIEVDTATDEDIKEMFNQQLAEAQRKQEEKEYIESDRAMFDYDVLRGK
ncbi:MAG: hypothetical protein J5965_18990 [Aeriscardovia sp.]|nr:hypothetical protein [Aeriscardovia sp.]